MYDVAFMDFGPPPPPLNGIGCRSEGGNCTCVCNKAFVGVDPGFAIPPSPVPRGVEPLCFSRVEEEEVVPISHLHTQIKRANKRVALVKSRKGGHQ